MSDTFDHELDAALEALDECLREGDRQQRARRNFLIKALNARDATPAGPTRDFMSAVLVLLQSS